MSQLNLSAWGYHRVLKLAWTIADLVGSEDIQSAHLAEALHASQSSEVDVELNIKLKFSVGVSLKTYGQMLSVVNPYKVLREDLRQARTK